MSGQWRVAPLATMEKARMLFLGLDYAAAKAGLDLAGVTVTPEVWAELRLIEDGALQELNRAG